MEKAKLSIILKEIEYFFTTNNILTTAIFLLWSLIIKVLLEGLLEKLNDCLDKNDL